MAAAAANPPAMYHPPPPPPPQIPAVYAHEMYLDPHRRRRETAFIFRAAIWVLSVFLVFSTLSVLTWVMLHPTFPRLHVISATLSSSAAAEEEFCNITFLLTNPNRHLNTIYDAMEFSLLYPSQKTLLSQDRHPPFAQPKRSQSTVRADLSFDRRDLGGRDSDGGSLSLAVKIMAAVRYRIGKWQTSAQYMRAYCGGVSFGFTSKDQKSGGIFLNPYQECEVYLYTN